MSKYRTVLLLKVLILSFLICDFASAQIKKDTSHYPVTDRRGDAYSQPSRNPFDISRDTTLVKKRVEYDPVTNQFYVYEMIGNQEYRVPTPISAEEFIRLQSQTDENNYFLDRSRALDILNAKTTRPKVRVFDNFFNRTFGVTDSGKLVDIKPQGNFDLKLGVQRQFVNNPTLSEKARRSGGFDMDMNFNVNILAKIGSKLTLPISYNTQSTFDFENQLKLNYSGTDDEILKSIEAGNISFQNKGTLMTSFQNLFGIKAKMQFGKLFITAAVANDNAQKQSMTVQSGGLAQKINKKLDDYDENRNFLLGQYFRKNFNKVMGVLPTTLSQVEIVKMEVWVTNRTGTTSTARNIVGLMDLGESQPYNSNINSTSTINQLPSNDANDLYSSLSTSEAARNPSVVTTVLNSKGLTQVNDFEKVYARRLTTSEYTYNPKVGFISINQQLQPDDVLGVAYQYSYNGKVYQVGEFSQDVAVDSTSGVQRVLFLKLLKATAQRVQLPIWDLMMKNVYSLDLTGIDSSSLKVSLYYQEPSGGTKRYLPESSEQTKGKPILQIINADRLNVYNNPLPDGQFDFISGYTVLQQQGKIIFPVLEPFGHDLDSLGFQGVTQDIKEKYLYYPLYDSIKAIAQTYANLNRYLLQGTVTGTSSSTIQLNAANIAAGSVTVTSGGQLLVEGQDYAIDYSLGTLTILNGAILSSGVPVNVQYENNTGLTSLQRSFFGLRLDYLASDKLSIGATMEKLSERPYYTKMSYGEDPISNTMYGVDFNYNSEWPALTRALDKLPFYSTTATSTIRAYGEAAMLKPGHPAQIGSGTSGAVYIDDFEGANSTFDLRYPFTSWALASTPGGKAEFPEASLNDSIDYGKNRAKLAWYNIEPVMQDKRNSANPLRSNLAALSDPRVRAVYNNELFPQQSTTTSNQQLTTFDLSYYPTEKGPYNFESSASELDANGRLRNPKKRWGGIMRALTQTDFVTSNYEYIEFWVQDPFIKNPSSTGGKLVFNLGNVSEDVLKDGKRFYENGMSTPTENTLTDNSSTWGKTPVNPIQVTNGFSNTASDRPYQDVGFDGMNDEDEVVKRADYLNKLAANFGTGSLVYQNALKDPSADNYIWYRSDEFSTQDGLLARYKNFNNPQGNSPVSQSSTFSSAATSYPDNEDLNGDNNMNETEEYFEYSVDMVPNMNIGDQYIADIRTVNPALADGTTGSEKWYLFRIPIENYKNKIGDIANFQSIRFVRMYMTDFEDSTTLRFARLGLVRNQWRNFTYQLDTTGTYTALPTGSNTSLDVISVNIEDNSGRLPIPYKIPPGIERIQSLANNGVNVLQNEQAMSLKISNLQPKDARAVFKGMSLDMRQYGHMSMFFHAESVTGSQTVKDNDLYAVVRFGQDYLNNYYEVKIPLKVTAPSAAASAIQIWPTDNDLDLNLQDLVELKLRRNSAGSSFNAIYRETLSNGQVYSVMGNPNLAEVQGYLIGVENANGETPLSTEVWANELRLSNLKESSSWAALGRVDIQLADLGSLSVSGNTYSNGWGSIDKNVSERSRNSMKQIDAAISIDAGKLLPKSIPATIPIYASLNKTTLTPEYDPYDQDVLYKSKIAAARTKAEKDSIKDVALDQSTTKTISLTNVRFGNRAAKPKLWNISNFDFSYTYMSVRQSSPTVQQNNITRHRGGLGYTFNGQIHYFEPFKKMIKSKSSWVSLVRDFNFNLTPSLLSYRMDLDRQVGMYTPRVVNLSGVRDTISQVDTTFDKYFKFDRYYNLRWQLTKSLSVDFSAVNNALVDEPYGLINTKAKKDSVWRNLKKFGRTTNYKQTATISYQLPFGRIPALDFIDAKYSYTGSYNWIGASLLTTSLGNVIENGAQNSLNAELDFNKIYNKIPFLKKAMQASNNTASNVNQGLFDSNNANGNSNSNQVSVSQSVIDTSNMILPTKKEYLKGLKGRDKKMALAKWRDLRDAISRSKKAVKDANYLNKGMGGFERSMGQLVTMIKKVTVNYSTTANTRIPGFMDKPEYAGNNWKTMQPGLGFTLGSQPDSMWMNKMASKGYLSRDTLFNDYFRQTYTQTLDVTAQLEPIKEFLLDLHLKKSFNKDYSELFKDVSGAENGRFSHLSPYANGGFSISYMSIKTAFNRKMVGNTSELFNKFSDYRTIISQRLGVFNRYSSAGTGGFATGYGRYSQDVLIPAFIAAYTGQDPYSVSLIEQKNPSTKFNPFKYVPIPNWNFTYSGLSHISGIQSAISNINLTHSYSSTLSMNSFTSDLNYLDPLHYGMPGFIDAVSGNYVPFYVVPNVTISESFEPLLGIDVTTVSQSNIRFSYMRSRTISLSLTDYQVSEVYNTGITLGGSYRKKGVYIPLPGARNLEGGNDLNINLNLSIMDNRQNNNYLDQTSSYTASGQKVISISPSIDYILNKRIQLKFYFDQQRVRPYISTSYPTTTTSGGIQFRVSLAQ